jgi:hypothetical protein
VNPHRAPGKVSNHDRNDEQRDFHAFISAALLIANTLLSQVDPLLWGGLSAGSRLKVGFLTYPGSNIFKARMTLEQ